MKKLAPSIKRAAPGAGTSAPTSAAPRPPARAWPGPGSNLLTLPVTSPDRGVSATRSGLPPGLRRDLEAATQHSLAHVEIDATERGATVAEQHDAAAVTIGSTIHMGRGQPDAATPEGRDLLAHEVAHVVQATAPHRGGDPERDANLFATQFRDRGAAAGWSPAAGIAPGTAHRRPIVLSPTAPSEHRRLVMPDADHPIVKDVDDGDFAIQTEKVTRPGAPALPVHEHDHPLATFSESVELRDDDGDELQLEITYRLETRPAELGDVPDIWIYTVRRALLTLDSGEHAGATIVGEARVQIGADEPLDPRAAIARNSIGPHHWAEVYLAEAGQYVNVFGPHGKASLREDAAGNDLFAYDDPLRTLVGLKRILKQQHVAGHGAEVQAMHERAEKLLEQARLGKTVLENEIRAVLSYHDRHPGMIVPVTWLASEMADWLARNRQQGREHTEDARLVSEAHDQLLRLIEEAEQVAPPPRDTAEDILEIPGRFIARTAEGVEQLGLTVFDASALGVEAFGKKTGWWHFDYHPHSAYGQFVDKSHAGPVGGLVTIVNGFADQWSDAIERARNGDYRAIEDTSLDTLLMLDGAKGGAELAADRLPALVARVGRLADKARGLALQVPAEIADRLSAFADAADAFVEKQPAPMQMSAAGGPKIGGGVGGGPTLESISEGLDAAKEAYKKTRVSQVKQRAIAALKRRIGAAKAPDAAVWVTRVEAVLDDPTATMRFLGKLQARVTDPVPFMRKVELLFELRGLGADDMAEILANVLAPKIADPVAVLDDIEWLDSRSLSADARSMLARRAAKGDVDLAWVRRTKLTDAELDFLGQDANTSFKEFEEASDIPSRRAPGPADEGLGANRKIRGIAGEMVAQTTELPDGLRVVRKIISDNKEPTADFEVLTRDGKTAELEVKSQRAENWKQMIDDYKNELDNPTPGAKGADIRRLVNQIQAGHARGHRVYVAISDEVSLVQRRRLLGILMDNDVRSDELVFLPESDILSVARELRSHMGIPQPGGIIPKASP